MTCGIYKIKNTKTGKYYVGQSINIEARWGQHKRSVRYKNKNSKLTSSFRKHGIDNFEFSIICEVPRSSLNEYEISYIKYYDSFHNGYNSTVGGDYEGWVGVSKSAKTKEFREKTSKAQKKLLSNPETLKKRKDQLNLAVQRKEIEYEGVIYCSLSEFANKKSIEYDIKPATIISRYNKGLDIITDIREENKKIEYNGVVYKNINTLAAHFNLTTTATRKRLRENTKLEEPMRKEWYLYGFSLFTLIELANILGIEQRSVKRRIKNGEYVHTELIKTTNHKCTPTKILYEGLVYSSKSDLARFLNLSLAGLSNRIENGKVCIEYV